MGLQGRSREIEVVRDKGVELGQVLIEIEDLVDSRGQIAGGSLRRVSPLDLDLESWTPLDDPDRARLPRGSASVAVYARASSSTLPGGR